MLRKWGYVSGMEKKEANLLPHCERFHKNSVKSHNEQLQCSHYATSLHKPVEPGGKKKVRKKFMQRVELK